VKQPTIAETGRLLRSGAVTAVQLTETTFQRIDAAASLSAFTTLTRDRAAAAAARADVELRNGIDRGPLHGVPYAVKELIDVAGLATTGQSRLALPPASRDASVVSLLDAAGAILVGKTTTYEFGIEPRPGLDGPFPPARNPHNPDHTTGGSSSGSAAAVAGDLVRIAVGTDTGGSIRGPAVYCGVVGLKPTYGRVPRRGVLPLSPSLDHIGPIAATVAEAAVAFDAIAGHDPDDSASADVDTTPCASSLGNDIAGLRIGYARRWHQDAGEPAIRAALDYAAQALTALGAVVEEVELPDASKFDTVATIILQAEAFALHRETLASHPEAYGKLAYRHLAAGAVLSAADRLHAQRLRRQLTRDLHAQAFTRCDVLLTASVLGTAPRLDDDGRTPNQFRVFPFNVTGHPALALPIGVAANGLPFGMQLISRPFEEALICNLGHAYETQIYQPRARGK
jgi:aspartyl-tRNA(Asn)/glutamyl-tRNA(Gln) amidotransferase subunit A